MRDETLPSYRILGQGAAILGAILLLLPTLWLSFSNSDGNLLYTLILMGEALVLLLGGIGARIRVFVLSGTGLMFVGAIHALFLTTTGIPTPLVLTIGGVLLLAIATLLHLLRHRFKAAWVQWD
ncbi:MAG: hypothetical protein AUI36_02195 [Cyanobacteria bacterium 13_1_40CM_2_61_4]|nr:MAG: hypothetical protein AUI36_02195 [Cyanobacteria bacterium 13_1_40CM_2_61_4]